MNDFWSLGDQVLVTKLTTAASAVALVTTSTNSAANNMRLSMVLLEKAGCWWRFAADEA
jgi:hypothetical protein